MQSLLLKNVLPLNESSSLNESVLIEGIGGFERVPLHNIYLESNLFTGNVVVGIRDSFPIDGIHLLLGNDIAG